MDYAFSKINIAAEDVASYINDIEERPIENFAPGEYYLEKYPDKPELSCAARVKEEVLKRLRDALMALRKAEVYARRVEWLESDDDGYEAFILRTDKELKKLYESNEANGGPDAQN